MILERLPGSRLSRVTPAWKGATAVLIGGGPSLTGDQIEAVRAAQARGAVHSIAINSSYLWADFADVCYFADQLFWQWHTDGVPFPRLQLGPEQVKARFAAFRGQKCSLDYQGRTIPDEAVHLLRYKAGPLPYRAGSAISLDPEIVVTGRHGGYQALNIAILAGCARILLLGYDGRTASDGRSHFHGGHPRPTPPAAYQEYRRAFTAGEREIKATGVEVIQCSPGSAITNFPKQNLEAALAGTSV